LQRRGCGTARVGGSTKPRKRILKGKRKEALTGMSKCVNQMETRWGGRSEGWEKNGSVIGGGQKNIGKTVGCPGCVFDHRRSFAV